VLPALSSSGHDETAYRLLTETGCPSWLYPVTMGATTIWERWDSMLPDGTVNPDGMTSFNHYALGSVADWMHRTVAGLGPDEPGYRRLRVAPVPGAGLTSARATLVTPYGLASTAWALEEAQFTLDVTVPANATAIVQRPGADEPAVTVGAGSHNWSYPPRPEALAAWNTV
jgi:alpha-L-rhamnosidase